jgi:tripartite-type tricarboxylate transporter receptor subunit TctC
LGRPEVKEKLLSTGLEAVGSSPEELAAVIKTDMARLGKLFKEAGLR